ncbi:MULTISPECIES: paraquat-inducible protein A [unclassified Salipiger]|uniref:paraquat-inducible protein A n=1 Tax=unclassified Salipiger TaxID=2640570 RepID=UPI0013B5B703|nr:MULTISPECIES: paraquat-inducible protein A [unclassified Salipiger]NDV53830.1 paraquat-inducible protein A [Salipiger sp. PrR003]NDW35649.1 paraquat-inducible protein A [Salipiger sp. PrR007]
MLKYVNLALLLLYPLAWGAPLMHAGLLPLFGLSDISVLSGIATLWHSDIFLALVVALFALVAPLAKIGGLALVQFGRMPRRALPLVNTLGKLAMADIFLVAVYVTLIKGMGVGRIEIGWGLYLFTFCVLASLAIGLLESQKEATK